MYSGGIMKVKSIKMLLVVMFVLASCTSKQKIAQEDEFAVDAGVTTENKQVTGDKVEDELTLEDSPAEKTATSTDSEKSLEDELASLSDSETQEKINDKSAKKVLPTEPVNESATNQLDQAPIDTEVTNDNAVSVNKDIVQEPTPSAAADKNSTGTAQISNVIYQSNANGGAVVISANQPLQFSTRVNSSTNQFIVEVQNSSIPENLKRTLNTKDMSSSIGSVDIYQKPNVTRFVVQLRPDSQEPIIQQEGNSLLIIGASLMSESAKKPSVDKFNEAEQSGVTIPEADQVAVTAEPESLNENSSNISKRKAGLKSPYNREIVDLYTDGIMTSDDLEEFLISNNKFYGKKINIETTNMELVDLFKFFSEESGVNIIVDSSVTGLVTMKLRDVPWDQAFILILKKERLGFKRQGNVLRVGKLEELAREEDDAIELKRARKVRSPLIIKRFFIGYAKLSDLEAKISDFLGQSEGATGAQQLADSPKAADAASTSKPGQQVAQSAIQQPAKPSRRNGRVIADQRTNSLIVTETEDNMAKVEKLIQALDTQPQQVLIEGKVIEAKESYTRGMGVSWASSPSEVTTLNRVGIGINPILDAGAVVLNSNISWGQLDLLGRLDAQLQLGEREDKVRILSSPRITVLTNEQATITQTAGLLIPESVTQNNVTTVTNRIVEFGVNLSVTPTVSNEGTVLLDLDLKRDFLARVDSLAPERRSAKTKLIVKSGQTAVVGGIFESETREGNSGVPGMKDIPILGALFKSKAEGRSKNELVIFVTPTILKPVVGTEKPASDVR